MNATKPKRSECLRIGGVIYGEARHTMLTSDPHEHAKGAYLPGGPSVEEIEQRIIAAQTAATVRSAA